MENKVQQGKWYDVPMSNRNPFQDVEQVTSYMQVPGGVLVRSVTFIGGNKFSKFAPEQSSESMAFIPHAVLGMEGDRCIFNRGPNR
jgi:hypothetical protein